MITLRNCLTRSPLQLKRHFLVEILKHLYLDVSRDGKDQRSRFRKLAFQTQLLFNIGPKVA